MGCHSDIPSNLAHLPVNKYVEHIILFFIINSFANRNLIFLHNIMIKFRELC